MNESEINILKARLKQTMEQRDVFMKGLDEEFALRRALELQKSALETDLMRLMTAIGPYSTVDSAAKFATKTRQQWADLVDAARAMVKHQRDRHELSSCCHDVTPTPTYLLEKALGDMTEKRVSEPAERCYCAEKKDLCGFCIRRELSS